MSLISSRDKTRAECGGLGVGDDRGLDAVFVGEGQLIQSLSFCSLRRDRLGSTELGFVNKGKVIGPEADNSLEAASSSTGATR